MTAPPAVPELFLDGLARGTKVHDDLLGDLAEEFQQRTEREGAGAARW